MIGAPNLCSEERRPEGEEARLVVPRAETKGSNNAEHKQPSSGEQND